jgi:hypothetical protein
VQVLPKPLLLSLRKASGNPDARYKQASATLCLQYHFIATPVALGLSVRRAIELHLLQLQIFSLQLMKHDSV